MYNKLPEEHFRDNHKSFPIDRKVTKNASRV